MKTKNILGMVALLGFAVAMPNAMKADTCASLTATYAALVAAGTCTIGNLTFGGFTYTPSPTTLSDTNMTFSVLDGVSGAADGDPTGQLLYGFEFNPALTVSGASMSEDILISYYVVAPTDELTSLHIALTGSGITTGSTTVTEGDCGFTGTPYQGAPGKPTGACTLFNPELTVNQPTGPPADYHTAVGPFGAFAVSKDINVATGAGGGTASVSGVLDAFDITPVPEPATVSFLLLGCLGLVGAARRRKQAQ